MNETLSELSKSEEKYKKFSELLDKINYASSETKRLWSEIYENAVNDRVNTLVLFTDLFRSVINSPTGHSEYGKLMTSYLEKMNKANDQLLKLAELIETASHNDTVVDADALYEELNK